MTVKCPYCSKPAGLVTGKEIYPHRRDLWEGNYWNCVDCKAWVGCHRGGNGRQPLGRLADRELRNAKQYVHRVFDPLWKGKGGHGARRAAYSWLARMLDIKPGECHVGMFDVPRCRQAYAICKRHGHEFDVATETKQSGEQNGQEEKRAQGD